LHRELSIAQRVTTSLHPSIWNGEEPWTPPPPPPGRIYHLNGFTPAVYRAAVHDPHMITVPELHLQGDDINQLVDQFTALLDEAGQRDDYTLVLTPSRRFVK
jgi:hypothetical protein